MPIFCIVSIKAIESPTHIFPKLNSITLVFNLFFLNTEVNAIFLGFVDLSLLVSLCSIKTSPVSVSTLFEYKYNNNVSNLEWCTQGYNQKEAYRLGLRQPTMHNLGKTGKLCPNSKPVYQFNKNGVFIKYYDGASEAGRQTGISKYDISACCRNIQKTAGGYIWRYANK